MKYLNFITACVFFMAAQFQAYFQNLTFSTINFLLGVLYIYIGIDRLERKKE